MSEMEGKATRVGARSERDLPLRAANEFQNAVRTSEDVRKFAAKLRVARKLY